MLRPIETERLLLRPLEINDAEKLFLLDSNPEVMKYIGIDPISEPKESETIIEMIQSQYDKYGVGRFAVIEKSSNLLIGWSGLKYNTDLINNYQNFYELGYRFLPEYWGKGYARESSKAFLKTGFEDLNIDIIYAYAHSENTASLSALKKLGFRHTNNFEEPDGICQWFELKKLNFSLLDEKQ